MPRSQCTNPGSPSPRGRAGGFMCNMSNEVQSRSVRHSSAKAAWTLGSCRQFHCPCDWNLGRKGLKHGLRPSSPYLSRGANAQHGAGPPAG